MPQTLQKTLVLKVSMDEETEQMLEEAQQSAARWMNAVFRKLYADKRNNNWAEYGPDREWDGSYSPLVKVLKSGAYRVNKYTMYPAFIRRDAPGRTQTRLRLTSFLQAISSNVSTMWSNFLNGVVRPKGRLPVLKPFFKVKCGTTKIRYEDGVIILDFPHPFTKGRAQVEVCGTSKYNEYMAPLRGCVDEKNTPTVEFRKRDRDEQWFAHMAFELPRPDACDDPWKVAGVDMGVRNIAAVSVVRGPKDVPEKSIVISGMEIVHELEHIHARMKGLYSLRDRGSGGAKEALDRLRGKRRRVQQTAVRQVAARIVYAALDLDADAIAVEDLRSLRVKRKSLPRGLNRRITLWMRGELKKALSYECMEAGLKFTEDGIYARGTSSSCPACGAHTPKSRDRSKHLFACKECGWKRNDDASASIRIAQRGWNYFHGNKLDHRPAGKPRWIPPSVESGQTTLIRSPSSSSPQSHIIPSQSTPAVAATGEECLGSKAEVGDAFRPQRRPKRTEPSPTGSNTVQVPLYQPTEREAA